VYLAASSCPDRFLTWPEVHALIRLSRSTVWRLEKAGKFPPRVRISPGRVGWRASEIHDYIAGRWRPTTDAA
jgi:prophage regulatory protein